MNTVDSHENMVPPHPQEIPTLKDRHTAGALQISHHLHHVLGFFFRESAGRKISPSYALFVKNLWRQIDTMDDHTIYILAVYDKVSKWN